MKKKDTTKLTALKSQMKDMSNDYQDMIKARAQSKKQLEDKFQDVYNRIEENRQFTVAEGNHVMETLKQFQDKFENKLLAAEDSIRKDLDTEKKEMASQVTGINTKLNSLDKALASEKEERIRTEEENLAPIRKDIDSNC